MAGERFEGTVKRYDPERGSGFISWRPGQDMYVHRSEVERLGLAALQVGDKVSFIVQQQRDGRTRAAQLQLIGTAQPQQARSTPQPASFARPDATTAFRFGPEYLQKGYFEEKEVPVQAKHGETNEETEQKKETKRYLRPEVIDTLAIDVAKALGNAQMKSAQLRRFFGKARGIEAMLNRTGDFEEIKAQIYGFKRDVAYQVGRRIVPEAFQQFINRNVELAVIDEKHFRKGFLQHFESVVAYFVYYFREQ